MHFYYVFGLRVRSVMPLEGVFSASSGPVDLEIGYGSLPQSAALQPGYNVQPEGTLLNIADVGRYWIEAGCRITVDPDPRASERNVRLFLLGSALGAILHQRGLVPLHANAVEIAGRAVAFMGHSGAGKSTMAAWFLDRGRAVLTDDVCVVEQRNGNLLAHRGLLRLRLWRDALERSGREAEEAARSFDRQDKFDVAMPPEQLAPPALPLGAVVILSGEREDVLAVRRLRGMRAVQELMANVYRGGFAEISGGTGRLLTGCAAIAAKVPVLAIDRVWGLERYDEQAMLLEQAVTTALAEQPRGHTQPESG